jgi:hypothetical protein
MPLYERYPDLLDANAGPELERVIAVLDAVGAAAPNLPPDRNRSIHEALHTRARETALLADRRIPTRALRARRTLPLRLGSLGMVLVIALGGILGYLRLQPPTQVSAAQLLHRAAQTLAAPLPGDVLHERTSLTAHILIPAQGEGAPSTYSLSTEQWAHFAPDDVIDRFSLSISDDQGLVDRLILNDRASWSFDPRHNLVTHDPPYTMKLPVPEDGIIYPKLLMIQPQNVTAIHALLQSAASRDSARLLPQQTLDGRTVDVVEVTIPFTEPDGKPDLSANTVAREVLTIYIGAGSTVARIDQQSFNAQGDTMDDATLRIGEYQILPQSQVPAGTFDFTPPPGANVQNCSTLKSPQVIEHLMMWC